MVENAYLCIEMSSKGLISRMSDECLMKQETVFSFYTQYQAVMRKFTLAGKSFAISNSSATISLMIAPESPISIGVA